MQALHMKSSPEDRSQTRVQLHVARSIPSLSPRTNCEKRSDLDSGTDAGSSQGLFLPVFITDHDLPINPVAQALTFTLDVLLPIRSKHERMRK